LLRLERPRVAQRLGLAPQHQSARPAPHHRRDDDAGQPQQRLHQQRRALQRLDAQQRLLGPLVVELDERPDVAVDGGEARVELEHGAARLDVAVLPRQLQRARQRPRQPGGARLQPLPQCRLAGELRERPVRSRGGGEVALHLDQLRLDPVHAYALVLEDVLVDEQALAVEVAPHARYQLDAAQGVGDDAVGLGPHLSHL